MSKTLQLTHIVFGTKNRISSINPDHAEDLYRLIWSMLKEKRCYLLRINGMPDHLHIFVDIHPSVALATLMEEIKSKTSQWMKKSGYFPLFDGWCREYFAESKGILEKDRIIEYIKGQQTHHHARTYADELKQLYTESGHMWFDYELT